MPACIIRSTIAAATGACSSVIGSTRTCSGASHVGNAPAKCSMRIAMNRSNEPLTARWITTGPMRRVVLADVREIEALGRHVVELDRAELPRAADGIGDVEVDLRAIERAVALLERVRLPRRLERGLQRALGAVPHRVVADARVSGRVANFSVAVRPNDS